VAASESASTISVGESSSDVHLIDLVEKARGPPTISRRPARAMDALHFRVIRAECHDI
jgi:hypothetical protein